MADSYVGSEEWRTALTKAVENWTVIGLLEDAQPVREFVDGQWSTRLVAAEAKTGSRYEVIATWLGADAANYLGGPLLVTVMWPWQDAWCLQTDGYLHTRYVVEHFCGGRSGNRLHAGDLAALTLTIAYALGRTADPLADAGITAAVGPTD